jgi:ribonuclease HII
MPKPAPKQELMSYLEQLNLPNLAHELEISGLVCGVDEVGRGCLAGDVYAASVCFHDYTNIPSGIKDSKKLTANKRAELYKQIIACADVGVGVASVQEIDKINILQATMLAMQRAIDNLTHKPDFALIDGNKAPTLPIPAKCLIKGDNLSVSIAAASIVAKHLRDAYMQELDKIFPQYGFAKHVGYGTAQHLSSIKQYGATSLHRHSFKPIKNY